MPILSSSNIRPQPRQTSSPTSLCGGAAALHPRDACSASAPTAASPPRASTPSRQETSYRPRAAARRSRASS
eukprot:5123569-Prymnesium_polylepis.1